MVRGHHGFVRRWRHQGRSIRRTCLGRAATVQLVPVHRQQLLQRLVASALLGQQFLMVLACRQQLLEFPVASTFL